MLTEFFYFILFYLFKGKDANKIQRTQKWIFEIFKFYVMF